MNRCFYCKEELKMKFRFLFTILTIAMIMLSPAFAGTIRDDFEDGKLADFWDAEPELFINNANFFKLTDDNEDGGVLNISLEAGKSTSLWIREPISGDFEVSVEYHDYQPNDVYPKTNIEIKFRDADNVAASTFARLGIESGGSQIMVSGMEDGTWIANTSSGNWSSPDGKAKLIKRGNTVTAIVWDGDEQLEIDKEYTFDYDPVIVLLKSSSWGNVPVPSIALDNFELTGDSVPNMGAAVTSKDKLPLTWAGIKVAARIR
jgi:hypothetical protein